MNSQSAMFIPLLFVPCPITNMLCIFGLTVASHRYWPALVMSTERSVIILVYILPFVDIMIAFLFMLLRLACGPVHFVFTVTGIFTVGSSITVHVKVTSMLLPLGRNSSVFSLSVLIWTLSGSGTECDV